MRRQIMPNNINPLEKRPMRHRSQMNDGSSNVPANDRLHDVETIARRLDISSKTVRRKIDRGELGHYRVGRLLRISEGQFQEYLASVHGGRP